jgi:hypothetical protein
MFAQATGLSERSAVTRRLVEVLAQVLAVVVFYTRFFS